MSFDALDGALINSGAFTEAKFHKCYLKLRSNLKVKYFNISGGILMDWIIGKVLHCRVAGPCFGLLSLANQSSMVD